MDKIAETKKEMRLKAWTEMYAEYQVSGMMIPEERKTITSDDVFDYRLDLRTLNKGIDNKREELIKKYKCAKFCSGKVNVLDEDDQSA